MSHETPSKAETREDVVRRKLTFLKHEANDVLTGRATFEISTRLALERLLDESSLASNERAEIEDIIKVLPAAEVHNCVGAALKNASKGDIELAHEWLKSARQSLSSSEAAGRLAGDLAATARKEVADAEAALPMESPEK